MKKQLFFFVLILSASLNNLQAMQLPQAESAEEINQQLQEKQMTSLRIRKALYLRAGVTAAMLVAAVGCGIGVCKNLTSSPQVTVPPPPSRWHIWRSAPPPIVIKAPSDPMAPAKVVGFLGSIVGLIKNIVPCWQQFVQFGSLKKDTTALLVQQKELLEEQKHLMKAQEIIREMLNEKDVRDRQAWDEQHKDMHDLQEQQKVTEEKLLHASEEIEKQIAGLRYELHDLLTAQHEKHTDKINQLIAQIAELVQLFAKIQIGRGTSAVTWG